MPRKPKPEKVVISVIDNSKEYEVYLHPPKGKRATWYVYWSELNNPRSTGKRTLEEAKAVMREMLRRGGNRNRSKSLFITDEEFIEIQRRHFAKKQGQDARRRAEKSLRCCLEAISAFQEISRVSPVCSATPEDCETFQHDALALPKNWRVQYSEETRNEQDDKEKAETLSANTVVKWSVALRAAFERANDKAGKKCVRSVVPKEKLLSTNPWKEFSWIEGFEAPIRQFDTRELLSILDYFEQAWPLVTAASLMAKVFLWSWCRKSEVAGLRWDMHRQVGEEHHFAIVGKWGVDKWFRIPVSIYQQLSALRTDSPFVFATHTQQLQAHHRSKNRARLAEKVAKEFKPDNLGDWFYERIKDWSQSVSGSSANIHIFRKTTLQYARAGEDVNRRVASDARLGERVMMRSYVNETDEQMRERSNRTFERILRSLEPDVAVRYGFALPSIDPLVQELNAAIGQQNWQLVASISSRLEEQKRHGNDA